MSVKWNQPAVVAKIRAAAARGVVRGQHAVADEAVSRILNPPKTGRIYRRRGVEHQASAPGQSPANDTGHLAGNVTVDPINMATLTGTVTSRAAYAAALEFGTAIMEPRPYMRPALEAKRAEIETDIANEIRRALKDA